MKRIDRLLGEARLMRILRASRAKGEIEVPSDFDWLNEMGCIQALIDDLTEEAMPADAHKDRREPIDVLDRAAVAPFMSACLKAIVDVYVKMQPQKAVADGTWKRVVATISKRQDGEEETDIGPARRAAVEDLAVLALQMSLFEVVRQAAAVFDLDRKMGRDSDPASIIIEGGRARRKRRPRQIVNADEIASAALSGRAKPVAVLKAPKSPLDDEGRAEMAEAMRGVREAAKKRRLARGDQPASKEGTTS